MVFEEVLGNLLIPIDDGMKTMNKPLWYIVFFVLAVVTSSCTSTRSLLIQIPESGEKELPQKIQSLTIVAQTASDRFTDLSADSLQNLFYKQSFNLDTVIYDRQVADTTIRVLGQLLFESGRYDYVIPENRFIRRPGGSSFSVEMPWDQVEALCQTYNTDAVLSLDHLSTRVITDLRRESYLSEYGYETGIFAQMKVIYDALFRVYYPDEKKVLVRELVQDTLVWEDAGTSVNGVFSRFTPVKQAIVEAGINAALTLTDKIAVVWDTERRVFFDKGNNEFERAAAFVDSGDWQSAINVWSDLAKSSNSKSERSKAFFNMAVGYEMLGDLNQAISLAVESYQTMYRAVTYEYLEHLKDRKTKLQKQTK